MGVLAIVFVCVYSISCADANPLVHLAPGVVFELWNNAEFVFESASESGFLCTVAKGQIVVVDIEGYGRSRRVLAESVQCRATNTNNLYRVMWGESVGFEVDSTTNDLFLDGNPLTLTTPTECVVKKGQISKIDSCGMITTSGPLDLILKSMVSSPCCAQWPYFEPLSSTVFRLANTIGPMEFTVLYEPPDFLEKESDDTDHYEFVKNKELCSKEEWLKITGGSGSTKGAAHTGSRFGQNCDQLRAESMRRVLNSTSQPVPYQPGVSPYAGYHQKPVSGPRKDGRATTPSTQPTRSFVTEGVRLPFNQQSGAIPKRRGPSGSRDFLQTGHPHQHLRDGQRLQTHHWKPHAPTRRPDRQESHMTEMEKRQAEINREATRKLFEQREQRRVQKATPITRRVVPQMPRVPLPVFQGQIGPRSGQPYRYPSGFRGPVKYLEGGELQPPRPTLEEMRAEPQLKHGHINPPSTGTEARREPDVKYGRNVPCKPIRSDYPLLGLRPVRAKDYLFYIPSKDKAPEPQTATPAVYSRSSSGMRQPAVSQMSRPATQMPTRTQTISRHHLKPDQDAPARPRTKLSDNETSPPQVPQKVQPLPLPETQEGRSRVFGKFKSPFSVKKKDKKDK